MLKEVVRDLSWADISARVADFTVGGGGHLEALLKNSSEPASILAVDQDLDAIERCKVRLAPWTTKISWTHANFSEIRASEHGTFDRILVDLGVSSFQLDQAERGFSFQKEGPLDMRMNASDTVAPAWQRLAQCSEEELADVFFHYGEESRARKFARKWMEIRGRSEIKTTGAFVRSFGFELDSKDRQGRHPLTKIFQALRIWVNDELGSLETLIEQLPTLLNLHGRVGIITFHSLEDRAVKWGLRESLKPLHKKPVGPTDGEIEQNARARSAKLRVFEKL